MSLIRMVTMPVNNFAECIQAEESRLLLKVWLFTLSDQAVIRGTWLFRGQLDLDTLRKRFKSLLDNSTISKSPEGQ